MTLSLMSRWENFSTFGLFSALLFVQGGNRGDGYKAAKKFRVVVDEVAGSNVVKVEPKVFITPYSPKTRYSCYYYFIKVSSTD